MKDHTNIYFNFNQNNQGASGRKVRQGLVLIIIMSAYRLILLKSLNISSQKLFCCLDSFTYIIYHKYTNLIYIYWLTLNNYDLD